MTPQDMCEGLAEVVRAELPALRIAFAHRRALLAKELGEDPGEDIAKQDFLEKYFNPFAEGWKLCYCYNVCEKRDNCQVRENEERYLTNLRQIVGSDIYGKR